MSRHNVNYKFSLLSFPLFWSDYSKIIKDYFRPLKFLLLCISSFINMSVAVIVRQDGYVLQIQFEEVTNSV